MDKSDTPVSLEGEILQGRYAIVEVTQVLGDWIRCVLFDMQQMTRRQAVVELREGAEPEVQLLPVEEPAEEEPAAAPAAEEQPAPPEPPAPPPPPEPVEAAPPAPPAAEEEKVAPPPPAPPAAEEEKAAPPPPPAPAAEAQPETTPEPSETPAEAQPGRRRAKTGRLEAAWFALGAEREDRSDEEEEPDVEDGDVVIAPSKVEQVASELTTKTYMRYTLDHSGARHVASESAAFAVLRKKKAPLVLALVGVAAVVVVFLLLLLSR